MPIVREAEWEDGPMGPGFFIKFPRNTDYFYDGGSMKALTAEDPEAEHTKRKKIDEAIAVLLLMREQC